MAKDIKAVSVKIRRYILDGLRPLQAAKLAGISHETFYNWKEKHPEFVENIEMAESDLEHKWVKSTKKIALDTKNAQANIALLERRFQDKWSVKVTNELTGAGGASVVFKVDMSGGYLPPEAITRTTLPTLVSKDIEPS